MSEPTVDIATAVPTDCGLSYAFARRSGVLVKTNENGCLLCSHRIPLKLEARLEVQRVFGPDVQFVPVDEETFEAELQSQYRSLAGQSSDFTVASGDDLAALAQSAVTVDDLLDQRDDSPVIRLINALLLEAVREGASDIHIETEEKRVIVRFRVDGVLRDKIEPDRALAPLLVSRIKVMAQLDIAEKRLPHDGRKEYDHNAWLVTQAPAPQSRCPH
jgi:general secretion pathway protein E